MKKKKISIRKNWNQIKEKIKRQYAEIIDNDLLFNEGQDESSFINFYKNIVRNKSLVKVPSHA